MPFYSRGEQGKADILVTQTSSLYAITLLIRDPWPEDRMNAHKSSHLKKECLDTGDIHVKNFPQLL